MPVRSVPVQAAGGEAEGCLGLLAAPLGEGVRSGLPLIVLVVRAGDMLLYALVIEVGVLRFRHHLVGQNHLGPAQVGVQLLYQQVAQLLLCHFGAASPLRSTTNRRRGWMAPWSRSPVTV